MGAGGTFFGITAGFVGLEAIFFVAVLITGRKGENALKHVLCITAVVCCWIMWAVVYIAQLHPLVRPQLQGG